METIIISLLGIIIGVISITHAITTYKINNLESKLYAIDKQMTKVETKQEITEKKLVIDKVQNNKYISETLINNNIKRDKELPSFRYTPN